ncbi:hypothetical protein ACSTS3_08230 [Aquimarina muelleri]|uniref:hypothetical protein n=1 Tax=Aquimarina muelleri TaxID=279356 RepID=UPI003F684911
MKTPIILPVTTEEELKDLQYVLCEVIHLLSHPEHQESQQSIYWLSKILLFTFSLEE